MIKIQAIKIKLRKIDVFKTKVIMINLIKITVIIIKWLKIEVSITKVIMINWKWDSDKFQKHILEEDNSSICGLANIFHVKIDRKNPFETSRKEYKQKIYFKLKNWKFRKKHFCIFNLKWRIKRLNSTRKKLKAIIISNSNQNWKLKRKKKQNFKLP